MQLVVIHEGAVLGRQRGRRPARGALGGPDHRDRRGAPGHDGRPRGRRPHAPGGQHLRRPHPGRRGLQRRRQLLGGAADAQGSDVVWAGTANRTAKNIGVAPRPDVQAIVDAANEETAELRNQVIGTQSIDIRRDPTPPERVGDGQPGRRRDARQVPRRGRRPDELGRPAPGPVFDAARGRRGSLARSPGARSSPCCRSATAR